MTPAVWGRHKPSDVYESCNALTPAVWGRHHNPCGISGMVQYRPHNADRSERGLLNILPRTILGFPFEGCEAGARY